MNMYENLSENYKHIRYNISEAQVKYRKPDDKIAFMAVTKTVPAEIVNAAIDLGVDLLGENRVQEYLSKREDYKPCDVHFIGTLQSNKVRKVIDSVSLFHSVESCSLADEINRLSTERNRVSDVLIELNIGGEVSKSGVSPDDFDELAGYIRTLSGLRLRGIMVIPPPGDSDLYFGKTEEFYKKASEHFPLDILSMGMSSDYMTAVRYGSNILRIGSALFGERSYN
jgi:pyridoxal phosphate enzyme (YggS family)